jgi:hypothetical protein
MGAVGQERAPWQNILFQGMAEDKYLEEQKPRNRSDFTILGDKKY